MKKSGYSLGIHAGSTSVSVVVLDTDNRICFEYYRIHHGDHVSAVREAVNDAAVQFDIQSTGSTVPLVPGFFSGQEWNRLFPDTEVPIADLKVSSVLGAREYCPDAKTFLRVGGERFFLLSFDGEGRYTGARVNTSCAAGTGSFIDQQAGRLSLSGPAEIAVLADASHEKGNTRPLVATRCAVFAKTDLIHAQQEGYSVEAICDGLCRGLAKNLSDTLLSADGNTSPILFCGGVSRNSAVVRHLEDIAGRPVITHEKGHLFAAVGAAVFARSSEADIIFHETITDRKLGERFPPLQISLSAYPEFEALESYEFTSAREGRLPVEVDIYQLPGNNEPFVLGLDIGSTSTKAVLLTGNRQVLAGFYTRTAGRPVHAFQAVLEAIDALFNRKGIAANIAGFGTTGSGRRFVGTTGGADLILDEISAHARAAVFIDPEVDTIIEIGGQDAKFTSLKDGIVTSSIMNTVCAAGTGSFIEEQALRLGVAIQEYSSLAMGVSAPMASDRCTVFMERDINHFLREGYSLKEVLAAALHAVRENYLQKVARKSAIGKRILFQGATAKNPALVAAFEQSLGQPLVVSRYCHLTGAIGVALEILDARDIQRGPVHSTFAGIDLHKKDIPVRQEVCTLCANHCKLTIADMGEKTVAYGFLCGRDYDTKSRADNQKEGYRLLAGHKKALEKSLVFTPGNLPGVVPKLPPLLSLLPGHINTTVPRIPRRIGIPAGLYMKQDMLFWRSFFGELGFEVTTTETLRNSITLGKETETAEFCAPVAAMHGHIRSLVEQGLPVFLPHYLDKNNTGEKKPGMFCYYSQFLPGVARAVFPQALLFSPIVKEDFNTNETARELYRSPGKTFMLDYAQIETAVKNASVRMHHMKQEIQAAYRENLPSQDIHIILLGRPYTVMSADLNKGIPGIFSRLGVKAFYMDQIEFLDTRPLAPLLDEIHWYFTREILKAAYTAAHTDGAYPVFITSFKCSPDSFGLKYFRDLMDCAGKPYLVLELDEHDSSVGYETRIEAALRTFRNHFSSRRTTGTDYSPILPTRHTVLTGKTILLPNWDPVTMPLIREALGQSGYDIRLVTETEHTIKKGLSFNSGQCLPLNTALQSCASYIHENGLDPRNTLLWMIKARLSCNITLYPHHMDQLLADYGIAGAGIFAGEISMIEFSPFTPIDVYFAYLFGGMLRRISCRIRPYETVPGTTDRIMQENTHIICRSFRKEISREKAIEEVMRNFLSIPRKEEKRKKVAIFGDLYVRDNDVMNQDLIRFIEKHGGEVITTPFSHFSKMISESYFKRWIKERNLIPLLTFKAILTTTGFMERSFRKYFEPVVEDYVPLYDEDPETIVRPFNLRLEHMGESYDNLLKIHYIKKHHPDVELFVQTSPGFCCPGIVTEAMAEAIRKKTGVPVVSITYDGTGESKNDAIIPYLHFCNEGEGKDEDVARSCEFFCR